MLSKNERNFVKDPYQFSKNNSNVIRFRIRKKLKKTKQDLDLLMKNCDDIEISKQEILDVINLSDDVVEQKEISRLQKNVMQKYDFLSDYENW
ncbi:hypothetical protein [Candidatus Nitrosotenuis uzonensis]|uniref:Uncharacterized protein n=1 Tax=Candidatus Nitrosotenuis uzonensis TaxID=1407055 RepID=A0A812EZ38_9ARCH|nr:hypothetical protein [Candidatus Nitrosotenuis uzonensis]CAE6486079.1 conserved hypothetical protein [Candidatus Nitrosotenuis uzonensis]